MIMAIILNMICIIMVHIIMLLIIDRIMMI